MTLTFKKTKIKISFQKKKKKKKKKKKPTSRCQTKNIIHIFFLKRQRPKGPFRTTPPKYQPEAPGKVYTTLFNKKQNTQQEQINIISSIFFVFYLIRLKDVFFLVFLTIIDILFGKVPEKAGFLRVMRSNILASITSEE